MEEELHEAFAAHRVMGEWFKPVPALVEFATSNRDPHWAITEQMLADEDEYGDD